MTSGAAGPELGPACQQLLAEIVQGRRQIVDELTRRRTVARGFVTEDVGIRAAERPLARQRLEQHDADAVPVARFGQRLVEALLRRHVGGRPGDLALGRHAQPELGREAEVEQLQDPVGADEHVRRLDVAVELAGVMQIVEGLGQLPRRLLQQVEVARDFTRERSRHRSRVQGAGLFVRRRRPHQRRRRLTAGIDP